ncbi:TonB-dependent receptor plug domain-containing protein [Haliea sp.]
MKYIISSKASKGLVATLSSLICAGIAAAAEIEEIVVTAQKKEQSLVEVPISMSVIGANEIAEFGITSPFDILLKVPGIDLDFGSGGTIPRWNLRGLGFQGFQPGNGSPVAIYYDEVFSPDILQGMPLFDMGSVEVLGRLLKKA